jgi:DNA-binding CsgD family transcriptional regulator
MRHSPETWVRMIYVLRENEIVRAVLCLVLMLVLVFSGLTLWLALPLPIITYVGLSLALPTSSPPSPPSFPPALSRHRPNDSDDRRAFEACRAMHADLRALSDQVTDPGISEQLRVIDGQIGKILTAIQQDDKYEASRSLQGVVGFTKELLTQYVKVVVFRGFANERTEERILRNFTVLSHRFDLFWIELNQDDVVNFEALNETIELQLSDLGDLPDDTEGEDDNAAVEVADVIVAAAKVESASTDVPSSNGVYLTPREMEVLIPLVNGCTDQAIGFELGISTRTSEAHARAIREKFGVPSRTAAAVYAVIHGIVRPDQISFGRCYGADAEST